MASNVVNLNKFRKKKAKAEREKQADTNRRLHGRSRAEREREAADKARLAKKVEGAFLEREGAPKGGVPAAAGGKGHGKRSATGAGGAPGGTGDPEGPRGSRALAPVRELRRRANEPSKRDGDEEE